MISDDDLSSSAGGRVWSAPRQERREADPSILSSRDFDRVQGCDRVIFATLTAPARYIGGGWKSVVAQYHYITRVLLVRSPLLPHLNKLTIKTDQDRSTYIPVSKSLILDNTSTCPTTEIALRPVVRSLSLATTRAFLPKARVAVVPSAPSERTQRDRRSASCTVRVDTSTGRSREVARPLTLVPWLKNVTLGAIHTTLCSLMAPVSTGETSHFASDAEDLLRCRQQLWQGHRPGWQCD